MRDRRRKAFWVVDDFEEEIAAYCGAPAAVAVDSCTNALMLALAYSRQCAPRRCPDCGQEHPFLSFGRLKIPVRTYVGVWQAARLAGWSVELVNLEWLGDGLPGEYRLQPTRVVDAARALRRDCYEPGTLRCISFHAAKQFPLGRGGAILVDDPDCEAWLRRARMDGRAQGEHDVPLQVPGWHCFMPPPTAALGLWSLPS
ncbi:MAG TPA: DegT/DnrJ/EryC1/StrS family aminotransferase, partial [Gaiellaceae bacterium]|nr:DegT/DnrJ/EryC1/StrS family aminotransferase [Gaiellaceae bacterium]